MVDQIIQDLNEKGWCFRPMMLDPEHLAKINGFFDLHKVEFVPAKVGPKENKIRNIEVRGDYTFWLDPRDPPDVFAPIIDFLSELKQLINARLFLGLQEFECHLAYYPPGTFYKKHSDRHSKTSSRSLSFIFYLNENWEKENGGELVIYHQDGSIMETITPTPGAFVCFLSEDFPHEVKRGNEERRSLTGWMHTKIIY